MILHKKWEIVQLWTGADGAPNVTIYTERTLRRKKSRTYWSLVLSAPLMVLLWEQVSAPIWRSWGVENRVGLNGTTSRALSVIHSGEQHWKKTTTHKCKCRVSGRKVMETYCGEAFGWIVVRGCCLWCVCNLFSDSAWRLLNLCGCSSAPRHSYVYLHQRGCSWTTLSAKTSSEHQLLLR